MIVACHRTRNRDVSGIPLNSTDEVRNKRERWSRGITGISHTVRTHTLYAFQNPTIINPTFHLSVRREPKGDTTGCAEKRMGERELVHFRHLIKEESKSKSKKQSLHKINLSILIRRIHSHGIQNQKTSHKEQIDQILIPRDFNPLRIKMIPKVSRSKVLVFAERKTIRSEER